MNQGQAKLLICDYLRETGRKGVTSLMRDINRHARTEVFAQRTLEKWLREPDRMLQDENWDLVRSFINSDGFRQMVPYANEGPAEERLRLVGDGLAALYGQLSGEEDNGAQAIELLEGCWENNPNLAGGDVPRTICKMMPVPGKRFAKFAYIALFRSMQVSTTGLVVYLGSNTREETEYCHDYVLHLWRRRDPESDSKMPGALIYFSLKNNQPEFAISKVINSYFYKEADPIGARGDVLHALEPTLETARYKKTGSYSALVKFNWAMDINDKNAVMLTRQHDPIAPEEMIIDQLLEDVLPHGYAAT